MDEAAPAAARAAAEKKRPLLRRVPTTVIVTLLGIGLSAWLLPAITRQWDDRQKAHELKSAIVADIASATARALIGGEAVWAGQRVNRSRVAESWSLASLQIEARLRAYFQRDIVTAWQVYSWLVDRFAAAESAQAGAALLSATRGKQIHLDPGAAHAAALVLVIGGRQTADGAPQPRFQAAPELLLERKALSRLKAYLRPYLRLERSTEGPLFAGPRALAATLLIFQEEIAREVLRAHATGYSTTVGDFFHNLVP